ncbi:MAG: hypothetical protein AAGF26_15985 [Cyanobacteria bacterium P01_G01_bin.49]
MTGVISLSISIQAPSLSQTTVMRQLGDGSSLEAVNCLGISYDTWVNNCPEVIHVGFVDKNLNPSSIRVGKSATSPEEAVAIDFFP